MKKMGMSVLYFYLILLIGLIVAVVSVYAQTNTERDLRNFSKITDGTNPVEINHHNLTRAR